MPSVRFLCCCSAETSDGSVEVSIKPVVHEEQQVWTVTSMRCYGDLEVQHSSEAILLYVMYCYVIIC